MCCGILFIGFSNCNLIGNIISVTEGLHYVTFFSDYDYQYANIILNLLSILSTTTMGLSSRHKIIIKIYIIMMH